MKPRAPSNGTSLNEAVAISDTLVIQTAPLPWMQYALVCLAGVLGPLGFAPFHLPGLTLLSLATFFLSLLQRNKKQSFGLGLSYGLGYFGFGVSWVVLSIHDYGQLLYSASVVITLLFIAYLAIFPALVGYCFALLQPKNNTFLTVCIFSSLWYGGEYLRSHVFTGCPWLLVGISQIDTPLAYLAPLIGVSGLSLLCALGSGLLVMSQTAREGNRFRYLIAFVMLMLSPQLLHQTHWTITQKAPITVGAIQANLSMRDKWDDNLFWHLLTHYKKSIHALLGNQLIILPESAIPLPANYLGDYLDNLHQNLIRSNSALILGILEPTDSTETHYYNAMNTLGLAHGQHVKQHLVPFGEYIPKPFIRINHWLGLPEPSIVTPRKKQALLRIANRPIASLICYEIAYPELLRRQLPKAQWIVSISDNGWFGHSLASYQQLQMAQMLSLMTGRYQVLVNNDGLSSIIDSQGDIVQSLPPFTAGILKGEIFAATGATPWVILQDYPSALFTLLCLLLAVLFKLRPTIAGGEKRAYP